MTSSESKQILPDRFLSWWIIVETESMSRQKQSVNYFLSWRSLCSKRIAFLQNPRVGLADCHRLSHTDGRCRAFMGHRVDGWMRVTLSGLAHELWAAVPTASVNPGGGPEPPDDDHRRTRQAEKNTTTRRGLRNNTGAMTTGRFSTQTSMPRGVTTSRTNTSTEYEARAVIRRTCRELLIIMCPDSGRGIARFARAAVIPCWTAFYPDEPASAFSEAVMPRRERMSGNS